MSAGGPLTTPGDVTVGELWRSVDSLRTDVRSLPAAIAAELDTRMLERLSALRAEMTAADTVVMERLQGQINRITERMVPLQRAIYGAVGTVCLTVIGAVLDLIVHIH